MTVAGPWNPAPGSEGSKVLSTEIYSSVSMLICMKLLRCAITVHVIGTGDAPNPHHYTKSCAGRAIYDSARVRRPCRAGDVIVCCCRSEVGEALDRRRISAIEAPCTRLTVVDRIGGRSHEQIQSAYLRAHGGQAQGGARDPDQSSAMSHRRTAARRRRCSVVVSPPADGQQEKQVYSAAAA